MKLLIDRLPAWLMLLTLMSAYSLAMAAPNCTDLQTTLNRLTNERDQDIQDSKEPGFSQATKLRLEQRITKLNEQIAPIKAQLAQCVPSKAPARILEIVHTNPAPPDGFNNGPAAAIIGFGKAAPTPPIKVLGKSIPIGGAFPSVDAHQEWKQVLAPTEDYETALSGASGWVLAHEISGADVPFTHPFGRVDWEFNMAVDDAYKSLLAPGNATATRNLDANDADTKRAVDQAALLQIPSLGVIPNLMAVELDQGLVPKTFQDAVHDGDRVAVFGRWIVDAGHDIDFGKAKTFRSEIHPPLIMAAARPGTGSIANGTVNAGNIGSNGLSSGVTEAAPVTRVLFTSRPYLVSQRMTKNEGDNRSKIYVDSIGDDGPFFDHLMKELAKANENIGGVPIGSVLVEVRPKIKSHPFRGVQIARFVVRPPVARGPLRAAQRLSVAYQFTVRPGCAVQVIPGDSDSVQVIVVMNEAGYTPPPLPKRSDHRWSKEDLAPLDSRAASTYTDAEWLSAVFDSLNPLSGLIGAATTRIILGRGIDTDEYDVGPMQSVNLLGASRAVTAFADQIPANQGVVQDDAQPFPFFGWLELSWVTVAAQVR